MPPQKQELVAAADALAGGDYERAVSSYNRILKEDPNCAEAYFGKAEASVASSNASQEEVIACYRKAVELDSKNPLYHSAFGAYLTEIGRFNEAEAAYNKAADADPDNAPYYWSEFAVEYALKAPVVMAKFLDEKTRDLIYRKGLRYVLKALRLSEEEARRLLTPPAAASSSA